MNTILDVFHSDFFLWDKSLFQLINSNNNIIIDKLMWMLSSNYFGIALFIILSASIVYFYRNKSYKILILIILTITFVDLLSARVIKPMVKRPRPSHDTEYYENYEIHLYTRADGSLYRGGPYSFPSNHAANFMTMTIMFSYFLSSFFKRNYVFTSIFVIITILVCYSRIYLGVHYPFDIICGWLIAFVLSFTALYIYRILLK